MRPQTVHFVAQLVRHTRGLVTTTEKWVAQTPPEAFATECAEVIGLIRGTLTDLTTAISTPRSATAPLPNADDDTPGSARRHGRPILGAPRHVGDRLWPLQAFARF